MSLATESSLGCLDSLQFSMDVHVVVAEAWRGSQQWRHCHQGCSRCRKFRTCYILKMCWWFRTHFDSISFGPKSTDDSTLFDVEVFQYQRLVTSLWFIDCRYSRMDEAGKLSLAIAIWADVWADGMCTSESWEANVMLCMCCKLQYDWWSRNEVHLRPLWWWKNILFRLYIF